MSSHNSVFTDLAGTKPSSSYTAIIKQDGLWWIGWIEEIPGVNCQEATQSELIESLRDALLEVLEMNRQDAKAAAGAEFSEVVISL